MIAQLNADMLIDSGERESVWEDGGGIGGVCMVVVVGGVVWSLPAG